MRTKTFVRAGVTAAALGLSLLAPVAASAAPADGPEAKATERVWLDDGHASFESDGEHLFACDDSLDGETIRAEASSGGIRYKVVDTDGLGGGCGEYNLSFPENQDVNIRVCHGPDFDDTEVCSRWEDTNA